MILERPFHFHRNKADQKPITRKMERPKRELPRAVKILSTRELENKNERYGVTSVEKWSLFSGGIWKKLLDDAKRLSYNFL